jgi:flagellar hook assembly protein FlgD
MRVELAIYSPSGQLVRRLIDGPVAAGLRDVEWDGTNQKGQRVASGVYFYRFTAGKFTQTRKMILLK